MQHAAEVMKEMSNVFKATIRIPAMAAGDQWDVLYGAVQGGVTVLPTDSMFAFCYNNASAIPAQIGII